MSKTLVSGWHKKFQDDFTNHKDGSRPDQPKTVVTFAKIAAVAGLVKRDARLTMQNIAYCVGILSGSAHKILTQQRFVVGGPPWLDKKATCMKITIYKCIL